jgi:hypothetical protein
MTVGTGAAATGVGGPASGLMVNPPDNSAYLAAVGTTLKLAAHTRITADVNLGRLSQNDQFFPYLTNTAVVTPVLAAQTSSLPVQSLNGKINTTAVVLAVSSRPTEPLHLSLRYRLYDLDNQTPRITFPGYGSWDRTWSDGGRINVPTAERPSRCNRGLRRRAPRDARRRVPAEHHRSHVPGDGTNDGECRIRYVGHARGGYGEPPRHVREGQSRL